MDMSTTTFGVVVIQSAAVLLRRFSVRTVTVHGSMEMTKRIEYTAFGKTRVVPVQLHNMTEDQEHETTLWVERGEDYYALLSPQLRDKKVAIVTRDAWLKAEPLQEHWT